MAFSTAIGDPFSYRDEPTSDGAKVHNPNDRLTSSSSVPKWEMPTDIELRREALEASFRYWNDDAAESDDLIEVANAVLAFLKGEKSAETD